MSKDKHKHKQHMNHGGHGSEDSKQNNVNPNRSDLKHHNSGGNPQQKQGGGQQQNQQHSKHDNKHGGGQQQNQHQQNKGGQNNQGNNNGQNSAKDLQVDEDINTRKWTVHPATHSASETAKWVVECNSKNEAHALKNDIVSGRVKPPTEAPQSYGSPRKHANGKTIVYAKAS